MLCFSESLKELNLILTDSMATYIVCKIQLIFRPH